MSVNRKQTSLLSFFGKEQNQKQTPGRRPGFVPPVIKPKDEAVLKSVPASGSTAASSGVKPEGYDPVAALAKRYADYDTDSDAWSPEPVVKTPKRRRVIVSDSDSDGEGGAAKMAQTPTQPKRISNDFLSPNFAFPPSDERDDAGNMRTPESVHRPVTPIQFSTGRKHQDSFLDLIRANCEDMKKEAENVGAPKSKRSSTVELAPKRLFSAQKPQDSSTNSVQAKDEDMKNGAGKLMTPKRKLLPMGLPMGESTQERVVGEIALSFIHSFRAKDDNMSHESGGGGVALRKAVLTSSIDDDGTAVRFPHLDMEFLQLDKIQDKYRRKPTDDDYCARTLYVPDSFIQQQTPAHRQWWLMKSAHYDTVLFFKVGKLYELFHMDAVIGVNHLNLTYMKGKYAHCCFAEVMYSQYADQLVSRGFKVARVEQTEPPNQLEQGVKTKDKVVNREVCRVTSSGTRTYGVLETGDGENSLAQVDSTARHLLAFSEKVTPQGLPEYGVCFIDTSLGKFYVGQFVDDANRSSMRTLLAHYEPSQILYERGRVSPVSQSMLNGIANVVIKEALVPNKEFPTAENAIKMLSNDLYFGGAVRYWPKEIRGLLVDPNAIVAKCSPDFNEAIASLGAVIWYLKISLIDVDMLTMRNFERYRPASYLSDGQSMKTIGKEYWRGRRLVLDGITLYNLNIVPPLDNAKRWEGKDTTSAKFSLYSTINNCITPFGKRLLRKMVCAPSCDIKVLSLRQDCVQWLMSEPAKPFVTEATEILRKMPDLERLLQKIHTLGLKYRATQHPDSRAVMFEPVRYNKRKVNVLLLILQGFERAQQIACQYLKLVPRSDSSPLMEQCFGSLFPDMTEDLRHFQEAFDHEVAKDEGIIVPEKGIDPEYDEVMERIEECKDMLNQYLARIRKKLDCKSVQYYGNGRARYQLEIPDGVAKNLDCEFELQSCRKGWKRITTAQSVRLFEELLNTEARRDEMSQDVMRRVFADFDSRFKKWLAVTDRVAIFDLMLSLARYAQNSGLEMCRPEFVFDSQEPILDIVQGYHPSLAAMMNSVKSKYANAPSYIPNDTFLGANGHPLTMLLTGPNMGGKSTLMRQVAVLTILAQMGSMVPATKMRLSPVDRIFTRIGGHDRITAGQSTFYLELSEANMIVRDATVHSLVVMDELGRGTSTHDGTAIAYAVLRALAEKVKCRAFFSTHYHTLCKAVRNVHSIKAAHMACVVDNENELDPTLENVTFLYTLVDGICPKSYGFFAAKVSGIKPHVIRNAFEAAQRLMEVDKQLKVSKIALLKEEARKGVPVERLAAMIAEM